MKLFLLVLFVSLVSFYDIASDAHHLQRRNDNVKASGHFLLKRQAINNGTANNQTQNSGNAPRNQTRRQSGRRGRGRGQRNSVRLNSN
jgi:hypothetical protein